MMICSSKKGGKFKAQFSQDAAALLRACTVFESEPGPEHGDKPMMCAHDLTDLITAMIATVF
jgi:hypothetical protein